MALTKEQQQEIIDLIKRKNLYVEYTENARWSNFCHSVILSDVLLLKIKNTHAAQHIMKKIYEMNQQMDPKDRITCRVAAGGKKDEQDSASFSLTPWVEADIIINLELTDSDDYAVEQIDDTTVKIKPGLQIKALDEILDKMNLATLNPPSLINRVTPFGLAALGGHGTDLRHGAYADNIESITFLLMNGKLKTISRKTNPDDFELIASAHFGLFGIAVKMELKCKPAEKLKRVETAMSLPEFIEAVESAKLPRIDYPMFSVFYVPTYNNDLENKNYKNVKVIEYKPVPLTTEDKNFEPEYDDLTQWLQVELEENLRVTDVLALFPQLVPPFMKYIVARYAVGEEKVKSIGPAPAQYHYQTRYPNSINDLDGLFPVSDDLREMVTAFKKVAEETEDAIKRGEAPVTFGAYARLFQNRGYAATLAPGSHHSEKKYVCGFDVVSSPGAPGFEQFRDNLVRYLIEELGAKLHWGKYVPLDKGVDYEKMYSQDLPAFRRVLKEFYKENQLDLKRSPFLTEFPCRAFNMKNKYMPAVRERLKMDLSEESASPRISLRGLTKFLSWINEQSEDHESAHLDKLRETARDLYAVEKEKVPSRSQLGLFDKAGQKSQSGHQSKTRSGCPPRCVVS